MERKKKVSIIFVLSVLLAAGSSFANEKAPKAFSGSMMLEHVGMECSNCHGINGPKGTKMAKHPTQECTYCHEITGGIKTPRLNKKKISLSSSMMLEHAGIECTTCHGENGPSGVNMGNHPAQKCTDCHILELPAK